MFAHSPNGASWRLWAVGRALVLRTKVRYSLKAFLLAVTLTALFFGTFGWRIAQARLQSGAIERLRASGGKIIYDYWYDCSNQNPVEPAPEFWRTWLGDDLFHRVEVVELRDVHVTRAALEPIRHFGTFRYLDLAGSSVDQSVWQEIAEMTFIRELRMSGDVITESNCSDLTKFLRLERLSLDASSISERAMRQIGKIKTLQELVIYASASDEALEHLGNLTSLRALCIDGNGFTEAGFGFLRRLQSLEELDIHSRSITDDALDHCGELLALRRLSLYAPNVTGDGFSSLAKLPCLSELRCDSTGTTDRGLVYLADSVSLKVILMRGTVITEQGARSFRTKRPDVELHY